MTTNMMKSKILKKFSRRTKDKLMTLMSPFVASKSKKILFFHIAKTGGSKIHSILKKNGLDDGILSQKRGHYEEKLEYFRDIVDNWDQYYKFTMIRNKYEQLVSNWNYDKNHLNLNVSVSDPINHFRAFIKQIVKDNTENYDYWIDQYYLTMVDDKPIFDFVGNFENFQHDLDIMMKRVGIKKFDAKTRVNQVSYKKNIHFSKYYDDETRNIVHKKFEKEINHFGYKL
jgi:hypothetical protein